MRWWCQEQSSIPSARSVRPPQAQGCPAWWASHQVDGTVHPSAWQVRWRMARALRWAAEKSRRRAAEVEHFGVSVEDGGEDVGATGQPAGFAGADPGAVTQCADPGTGGEALEGDGHHHRGGGAAVQGQPVRVDGFEQGAEGLAAALLGGHPPPVGLVNRRVSCHVTQWACGRVVAGCGEGFQVGLQPCRGGFGDPGAQVDGSVAAHVQGEPGGGGGPPFGGQQRGAFGVVVPVGADHFQDPLTQRPGAPGV